ncbi:glycine--tRNA ligase subunit beta [Buchnera aphidicola (Ceratoglyphina bambusae)]|uniref:glycine--tRNA ligase subunit beta n=1 Tax=Buchnera aphidicola TaxID=9 RepID=UPI0031B85D32
MKKKFILEIITEELPSKNLLSIIKSLYKNIINELKKKKINYKKIFWYATSRRLIIEIKNILIKKDNFKKKIKKNKKKYKIHKKLKKVIIISIKKISIIKSMHWNTKKNKFIRPVRNILSMLDNKILKIKIFGINSHNYTFGHFFMKNNKIIKINDASEYKKKIIKEGKILIDFKKRKRKIVKDIKKKINIINATFKKNKSILNEINSTIEWPKIYIGSFKEKFLKLPRRLIIYVIEKTQKCITLYSKYGKLIKYFIIISNIISENKKKIILENEQTINERLKDINFFFKIDTKNKLISRLKKLKKNIFHEKLGNLFNKTIRIKKIVLWISKNIKINKKHAIRSALLSKCDLLTNMVLEFPEMQGYIGMKYAIIQKENKKIARSIKEQYYPLKKTSKIPKTNLSCAISISDKIDTIVGIFIIGKHPNGKNDPFYIRKNTIGIIRILLEKKIRIDIKKLIKISISLYKNNKIKKNIKNKIIKYFKKRILHLMKKKYCFNEKIIKSSIKTCNMIPINIYLNIFYVSNYEKINDVKNIYKRIKNITKNNKYSKKNKIYKKFINNQIEKKIYNLILIFEKKRKHMLKCFNYKNIFYYMNIICKLTNLLFKKIFINDKNIIIRTNRILILQKIIKEFKKIIDLKKI